MLHHIMASFKFGSSIRIFIKSIHKPRFTNINIYMRIFVMKIIPLRILLESSK